MVVDFTAHLLNIGGRGDGRDQVFQVFLEACDIGDIEEQEVLTTLRDTQASSK